MSSSQINLENADLEKLNDKDKTDLRQFLANEQQRSQIQARTSMQPPSNAETSFPPPLSVVCAHVIFPQLLMRSLDRNPQPYPDLLDQVRHRRHQEQQA